MKWEVWAERIVWGLTSLVALYVSHSIAEYRLEIRDLRERALVLEYVTGIKKRQ